MSTKKRQLFDAAEYVKRMDLMITNLRTKTPGEAVGNVGKNEILKMRREALQQLVKDGYTVNQIAEAMKDDVFSILPKTITEIIKPKTTVTETETETVTTTGKTTGKAAGAATGKTTGKAAGAATGKATNTQQNNQPAAVAGAPAAGSKATFEVKPDTRDL